MNCGDFRYLVQRRFDEELSPPDDRALLIHLEACESCQKFYHQVQQVIIAAKEMEISAEILPHRPEFLASSIIEHIPQNRLGLAGILLGFLSRLKLLLPGRAHSMPGNGEEKSEDRSVAIGAHFPGQFQSVPDVAAGGRFKNNNASPNSSPWTSTGAKFGRFGNEQESAGVGAWGADQSASVDSWQTSGAEGSFGASGSQAAPQESDQQLTTRSLGQKFGVSTAINSADKSQPLTLAESIRRKIAEMPKPAPGPGSGAEAEDGHGIYSDKNQSSGPSTDPHFHATNSFAAWGIPDSPDWPKISPDINANQVQEGTLAPNSWGSPPSEWSGPAAKSASAQPIASLSGDEDLGKLIEIVGQSASEPLEELPINQASKSIINNSSEQSSVNDSQHAHKDLMELPPKWVPEADQVETGNWQSVKLENTLGAPLLVAPSLSAIPMSSSPASGAANSGAAKSQPFVDQNISQPNVLNSLKDDWELSIQEKISSRAEQLQSHMLMNIPVVSPLSTEAVPQAIPPAVLEAIPQAMPPQAIPEAMPPASKAEKNEAYSSKTIKPKSPADSDLNQTTTAGGLKIYPVVSKRAAATAAARNQNQVAAGSGLNFEPAPPAINNTSPVQQTSAKQAKQPQIKPESKVVEQAEQDTSNDQANSSLFKFNDRDMDELFSQNLGVRELAVPTKSTKKIIQESEVLPAKQIIVETNQQENSIFEEVSTPSPLPAVPASAVNTNNNQVNNQPIPANDSSGSINKVADANTLLAPLDDNMIDQIFSASLGIPEQAASKRTIPSVPSLDHMAVLPGQSEQVAPATNLPTPNRSSIGQAQSNPFSQIQSPTNITAGDAPEAPPAVNARSSNTAKPQPGRGSAEPSKPSTSAPKTKIPGVGRLDSRGDSLPDSGSGRIASIGKFLLDNKDLEKIGKITGSDLSESSLRTLTLEASQELKNLLAQIDCLQGVIGTVIVGHDGLLIANTLPAETDAESLGVWGMGVYMGTTHVVDKLGNDKVRQIVSQTDRGYLVIANFGAGLLITLTNPLLIDNLLPLMRTITQLVAA